MSLLFESETCSRCGGSGQYSYCQSYGTTCFRCHGQKATLTKRGRVAQALFNSMLSKSVSALRVGDKFQDLIVTMAGCGYGWSTVQSITPNPDGTFSVETAGCIHANRAATERVRCTHPRDLRASVASLVLAYQSILSKSGKEPAWYRTIAWG